MDYLLKVKAKVYTDVISHDNYNLSTTVEVNVPIPEEKWESEMNILVDEIEADIENCDADEDDLDDASGYIGTDGDVYDCNGSQTRIAYHLMDFGGDMATILDHCSALGALRDAMVAELEANQPEKIREIQMLKDMKDLDSDDDDKEEDEEDWYGDNWDRLSDKMKMKEMVVGEYPLDMLDDLARRINRK